MRRALLVIALLLAPLPSAAEENVVATNGPRPGDFTPRTIVLPERASLRLAQLDPLDRHDLFSLDTDANGEPLFANGRLLGFGQTELVRGVEQLRAGRYAFSCSLHPTMFGELRVFLRK